MQFLSLLFLGLVVYYGYVAWRYGMVREWLGKRGSRLVGGTAVVVGDSRKAADGSPGDVSAVSGTQGVGPVGSDGAALLDSQAIMVGGTNGAAVVAQASGLEARATMVAQVIGSEALPLPSPPPLPLSADEPIDDSAGLSTGGAASPYGIQLPLGLGEDRSAGPAAEIDPELFKRAEGVISQLQDLVGEAAATQMPRPELESRVGELLAGNRQLWGTAGQVGVDNFLERCCRVQLRYSLTPPDIQGLWGVPVALKVTTVGQP